MGPPAVNFPSIMIEPARDSIALRIKTQMRRYKKSRENTKGRGRRKGEENIKGGRRKYPVIEAPPENSTYELSTSTSPGICTP